MLLIVDDNFKERAIYQRLLDCYQLFANAHYNLSTNESLNLLKGSFEGVSVSPDVVLLDLDESLTGFWDFLAEFGRLITALGKKVDVYVVSSVLNAADRMRAAELGLIKAYFPSPLSRQVLLALHEQYYISAQAT